MTVEFVKNKCILFFYVSVKVCYIYGVNKLFIDNSPCFNKNYTSLKRFFVFYIGAASLRAMKFPVILSED